MIGSRSHRKWVCIHVIWRLMGAGFARVYDMGLDGEKNIRDGRV